MGDTPAKDEKRTKSKNSKQGDKKPAKQSLWARFVAWRRGHETQFIVIVLIVSVILSIAGYAMQASAGQFLVKP